MVNSAAISVERESASESSMSGDERGRAAADAVERGDELRHLAVIATRRDTNAPTTAPTAIVARMSADVVEVLGQRRR